MSFLRFIRILFFVSYYTHLWNSQNFLYNTSMKKSFVTLGLLIALTPHLGVPQSWKDLFLTIAGLLIVLLVLAPRNSRREKVKKETSSFIENTPEHKDNNETSINQ